MSEDKLDNMSSLKGKNIEPDGQLPQQGGSESFQYEDVDSSVFLDATLTSNWVDKKWKYRVLAALVFLSGTSCARSRPRYIAIPVEDVRWLETAPAEVQEAADPSDRPLYRIPRGSYTAPPVSRASYVDPPPSSSSYDGVPIQNDSESEEAARVERQSGGGHHEYVDYGAHTGHHGAFGWYADFPVHKHSR